MRIINGICTCHRCKKVANEWVNPWVAMAGAGYFGRMVEFEETSICIDCVKSRTFIYIDDQGAVRVNVPIDNRTSTMLDEVKEGIL